MSDARKAIARLARFLADIDRRDAEREAAEEQYEPLDEFPTEDVRVALLLAVAAPDLLAALRNAELSLAANIPALRTGGFYVNDFADALERVLTPIRAAIAKATTPSERVSGEVKP